MKNRGRSTKEFENKCKYIILALEPKQQLALNIFQLSANDLPSNLMDDLLKGMDNLLFLYDLLFSNKYKNFREEIGVSNIKTLIDKAVFLKFTIDKIKEMPANDFRLLRLYLFKNRKMSEIAKKLSISKKDAYARYDILIENLKRGAFELLEVRGSKTEKFRPYPLKNLYSRSYLDILLAIAKLSDKDIVDLYEYFGNNIENPGLVKLNIDLQCRYSTDIMHKLTNALSEKKESYINNMGIKGKIISLLSGNDRKVAQEYYENNITTELTDRVLEKIDLTEKIVLNKYNRLKELFATIFIGNEKEIIKNSLLLSEIIGTFDRWYIDIFNSYFIDNMSILEIAELFNYSPEVIEKMISEITSYVNSVKALLINSKKDGHKIESIYKTLSAYTVDNVLNAILELDSAYRSIIFEVHGFNLEEPNVIDIEKVPYTTYVECVLPALRGILEKKYLLCYTKGEYFIPKKACPYIIKPIKSE